MLLFPDAFDFIKSESASLEGNLIRIREHSTENYRVPTIGRGRLWITQTDAYVMYSTYPVGDSSPDIKQIVIDIDITKQNIIECRLGY